MTEDTASEMRAVTLFVTSEDSPVWIPTRALLLLGGDDRLQLVLLPALLPVTPIRRGGAGDLLGLAYGGFLDRVRAIHGAEEGGAGF